VLYNIILQMFR